VICRLDKLDCFTISRCKPVKVCSSELEVCLQLRSEYSTAE